MATEAKSTNYWISSTALYIQLNAMGEPDYIQCSVVSGASILCYMSDVPGLGYDAGHNYQRWPLVAYPSIFPDSEKKYIYAAIPRVRKGDNDIATVVFPSQRIDIYGKAINEQTKEGGSKELVSGAQIGNENFYYIYLQGIISEVKTDADGQTRIREWEQHVDCGSLATDEALASGGEGSWWKFNSVSDTISFLKTILQANFEELTAKDAKIIKLGLNGKDLTGVADETTLENSNTTVVTPQYLGQFGVKHFLAKDKDDTAKGTITFEKVQRFLKGLLVGNSNSENGGSWITDAEGRSHLITDYLEVRMKAIFETLEILHTDTSGGELFITPVGSNRILKVEEVNITYDGVSQKAYRCYFLGEQDGSKVENKWKVGDQARSKSFNLTQGKYHNVGNHYYWRLVIGVSTETVEIDGKKYHYVDLSDIDKDAASDEPMVDDILNQCGNRTDNARQSCLVFSAVDTYSPSVTLYHGVNGYTFNNKEYVDYGVNHSTGKAFFHVYGDMYFGDRPTSANNYEGDSYVKYDSDKKKVTIKGDLDIKSTYDGKTLDKYIADKAAEKAQAEIKDTQDNLIALGTTVSNNKKAFDAFTSDGYLDSSEIAAIAQDSKRLEDDYNAAVESYNNVVGSKFLLDKDGKETTYKTDLVSAKAALDSAKNELITYLSDIVSRYNASDSDGKATIKAAAAQKYTNFTNAYKAFYDKLGVANNYITSNLFDGLNTELITNMAGLEYIKAALVNGKDTEVKGGLILSTLIALRNDKGNVTAGINGADTKENGIALWLGGKAIDRQASTTKEDEMDSAAKALLRFDGTGYFANGNLWWDADGTLHADPTSFIINKNNVGVQLALFAPVWKSGTTDTTKLANVLSIDPQKPFTHLDVSGNVTTEGSLKIGGIYLSYDSANNALRLSKDAAGKEAANFYALGGITAYGAGSSTSGGGGGLNGSVKRYSDALKLTGESLSEVASAYSVKALDSRISSLEGGSATAISVSGSGNAVTSIAKNGTTISVVKGSTFLTSHQSLDGYVNAIAVSGSGNAVTAVTKSGKTITFTKGATYLTSHQSLAAYLTKSEASSTYQPKGNYLTSHQSLANYYTKGETDSKLSGYLPLSGGTMSGLLINNKGIKVKGRINNSGDDEGILIEDSGNGYAGLILRSTTGARTVLYDTSTHKTFLRRNNGTNQWDIYFPDDAGTVALTKNIPTSLKSPNSLSWSGYNTGSYDGSSAKSFVIPSNTNQLTNGAGFITSSASISGNAATATKVNHSLLVFGKSFNGSADVTVADTDLIASISTGTSNVTDKTEILTSYASDNGFNDSNAKNKIHRRPASAIWGYINSKTISNADKLDNVHLNGIFTALSNTNNGVSMTIGTVAKSLANMQVYSATKLVTARNISIAGGDFVGNVNFDGTGNVSLNGAINYCTINIGNTDPNPFKRIAHIKVAHSWNDNALLLYISQGYNGGNFGLCRVEFRTNDIANSDTAGGGVSLRWLIRQGYATDSIQAGYYIHLKNAYVDVFLKTTGAYQGTVIRVIQDSRGSINNSFGLINSTYNTEAYTSLSAAATALYNVAYQGTVSGIDTCTVSHANSATKLKTSRTIWGQSFDGTGNVSGSLSNTGTITASAAATYDIGSNSLDYRYGYFQWIGSKSNTNFRLAANNSDNQIVCHTNGNVGIGTNDPTSKLYVSGSTTITGATKLNSGLTVTGDTVMIGVLRMRSSATSYVHNMINVNNNNGTIGYGVLSSGGTLAVEGGNLIFRIGSNTATSSMYYTYNNGSPYLKVTGNFYATGGITAYSSSDIRLKQDLRKLDYLGIIKAMGGTFGFAWKKDNTRSIGWIAQHVLCNPHLKDIVETDENGYYKINYWSPKLIATAFGAIEQVGDEVTRLRKKVKTLENRVKELEIK